METMTCPEHNVLYDVCKCDYVCKHEQVLPWYHYKLHCESMARACPVSRKWSCVCGKNSKPEEPVKVKTKADKGVSDVGHWYFITLTQPATEKTPEKLLKNMKKILRSKQVEPEQWAYSLELHQNGTPHIHAMIFTYRYLEKRVISGFNGGYRVDCQRERFNCKAYIVKDETKPTKQQLQEWNLNDWFFCSDNYSGSRPGEVAPPGNLEFN